MAEGELTTVKSAGSSSGQSSVSEFLKSLQAAQADEVKFEETLLKLKITNVENVGKINKKIQQELLDESIKAQQKLIDDNRQQRLKSLKEEQAAAAKMSDKDFAKKYKGRTRDQMKAEWEQKKKLIEQEAKLRKQYAEKEAKEDLKRAKRKATQDAAANNKKAAAGIFEKGASLGDRMDAFKKTFSREVVDSEGNVIGRRKANPAEALASVANVLSDMAKQLDNTINTVAGYKSAIDTRLQGLNRGTGGFFGGGSYWDNISKNITGIAGISPLIKQSALAERVNSMVSQGIAFNVEQRATLAELSGKIATTFDAANGTLLRLVRIQQQDTTAGRLGMESALTAFLNNMYQTTEYMTSIANDIKGNLEEAMSLMTGENAVSFEYQVQKWLGSMYSVGMSQGAVQGLGGVLGKLASGQLDAITQGGQGNLVIMAANQAGLNIADLLSNGLNADTTNELMNSMVDYLAKLYKEAGDSKVIQQQMASVYGMTAADLKAAVNLARSAGVVSRDGLTYATAMGRLNSMANSMYSRTSIGEMMTNAWDNLQYTMASGMANNPALYAMYKIAGLLDTAAGGIAIPAFSVMGNMVDLETTVADLMRAGAMGGSILAGIGTMIASGGNGGVTGSGILRAAGIGSGLTTVTRGTGAGLATAGGASVSESGGFVGNSNGGDVQNATMTSANDSAQAQLAEAVDESEETKLKDIHADILDIYQLLQSVTSGFETLKVDITNQELNVKML